MQFFNDIQDVFHKMVICVIWDTMFTICLWIQAASTPAPSHASYGWRV